MTGTSGIQDADEPGTAGSRGGFRAVAVDGGQTGLRLRDLSSGRTGAGQGFDFRGGSVTGAVVDAAAAAGLDGAVDLVCLGLTGVPADHIRREALAVAIATRLRAREVRVCSDMVTAHAGALGGEPGVVLAAGTGVACLGIDETGVHHRVDGWGHLFGDGGSGFDIGRRALAAVQRARDGQGPATSLTEAALQLYDTTAELLPQRLYTAESTVAEVARFAPSVVGCAEEGDEVAGRILAGAAARLAETAATGVERMPGTDPVSLARAGRLWNAGSLLLEPFRRRLADLTSRAREVTAQGDPLDGAARLTAPDLGPYRELVLVYRNELDRSERHPAGGTRGPSPPRMAPPFDAGGLVVSCQARADSPLHDPSMMAAMARAAVTAGAVGVRVNGPDDVAAVRAAVDVPVIGLFKQGERTGVYITPTRQAAADVVAAGADIVALDGTPRRRLDGCSLADQVRFIHAELNRSVMADVDSFEAGVAAQEAGADLITTSLAGYTAPFGEPPPDEPDLTLVARLAVRLDRPVIAEGRYRTAADMGAALDAGAYAVVIGTAITDPAAITRRIRSGGGRSGD